LIGFLADPHLILLDHDKKNPRSWPPPSAEEVFHVARTLNLSVKSVLYHRTRGGIHLVVEVRENLSALERVALQGVLRSDPRRTLLNLMRVRSLGRVNSFWRKRWDILYEEKLL